MLAILLDPDKISLHDVPSNVLAVNKKDVDFIFIGGSTVSNGITGPFVKEVKKHTSIPIILFPGNYKQLTNNADALLFLSLLSGRNPEYLIEQQIKSVEFLKKTSLEIIPTGYILVDGGVKTSVQKISETLPMLQENCNEIVDTALSGQFLGKQLIYLEAGSGAKYPVHKKVIRLVSEAIDIPLIVGGGIKSDDQIRNAFENGADLVVIGTAFEQDIEFLNQIT